MEEKRLQKFLAECGIASRRKCEELIIKGKVKVNGVVITELGTKVVQRKRRCYYRRKKYSFERRK